VVPKIAFGKMLERALNPPEEYMVVPYTANQASPLKLCVVYVNIYSYIQIYMYIYYYKHKRDKHTRCNPAYENTLIPVYRVIHSDAASPSP